MTVKSSSCPLDETRAPGLARRHDRLPVREEGEDRLEPQAALQR